MILERTDPGHRSPSLQGSFSASTPFVSRVFCKNPSPSQPSDIISMVTRVFTVYFSVEGQQIVFSPKGTLNPLVVESSSPTRMGILEVLLGVGVL